MTTYPRPWPILLAAAAIMMITMGIRQSLGLYVAPIDGSTGLGIVAISFALAIGQFVWGAVQPIFGALADRYGTERVLIAGAILVAVGLALSTFATNEWALIASLGVVSAAGAGAGSFSPWCDSGTTAGCGMRI
jgi:MFS family permease